MNQQDDWWRHSVFYQIYPRSFMDSNADGVGDLQGIIDRLDYLVDLGIDAIWLSPIFPSPMADHGYDISNHADIDPLFGDMATFDRLLAAAHERELRVVLDYIPNHTSDQHPWFLESRASVNSPKRDWYIWKQPKPDGNLPNNWESIFGGSAWQWDEQTEQYYLHSFLKEQPDLNWRDPELVEAMHEILRFWLNKGVDGFRMDAIIFCEKHPDFVDNPPIRDDSPFKTFGLTLEPAFSLNQPGIHEILRGFRAIFEQFAHRPVMIGETWLPEPTELIKYYGENEDELDIPFNFLTAIVPWSAKEMKQAISDYYSALPSAATPNFVFGNHDVRRLSTRYGLANHRSVAMLLLTLRGIPTMYYGDELGMEDAHIPKAKRQDPWGINMPALDLGRDPARTPMQWDCSPNAGFASSGVDTWLPLAQHYETVNVQAQRRRPESTLNYYRRLLKLRRRMPALNRGSFAFVDDVPDDVIAYLRCEGAQRVLVLINFEGDECRLNLSSLGQRGTLLLSSLPMQSGIVDLAEIVLHPNESAVILL